MTDRDELFKEVVGAARWARSILRAGTDAFPDNRKAVLERLNEVLAKVDANSEEEG